MRTEFPQRFLEGIVDILAFTLAKKVVVADEDIDETQIQGSSSMSSLSLWLRALACTSDRRRKRAKPVYCGGPAFHDTEHPLHAFGWFLAPSSRTDRWPSIPRRPRWNRPHRARTQRRTM